MPSIHVCPLSRLGTIVEEVRAGHIITLVNVGTALERPLTIAEDRHLRLFISDIVQTMDGHVLAAPDHVAALLDYMRAWDRAEPVVIHCWAGVSRSTAAAYASACALMPERDEADLARLLRQLSPTATPNARIVELADDMLGRNGRMVDAVKAIGRGEDCFEGVPFRFDIERTDGESPRR